VPVGISLAALLNGLFNYVWGVLKRTGLTTTGGALGGWGGLVLAIIISLAVTVILSWLIERDIQTELKLQEA
jgi:cellobiose-specific phosphotransferase system component IIC